MTTESLKNQAMDIYSNYNLLKLAKMISADQPCDAGIDGANVEAATSIDEAERGEIIARVEYRSSLRKINSEKELRDMLGVIDITPSELNEIVEEYRTIKSKK